MDILIIRRNPFKPLSAVQNLHLHLPTWRWPRRHDVPDDIEHEVQQEFPPSDAGGVYRSLSVRFATTGEREAYSTFFVLPWCVCLQL